MFFEKLAYDSAVYEVDFGESPKDLFEELNTLGLLGSGSGSSC